ncbi:hypothetical protein N6H14_14705 [Paenibacillus sp. CC-CFT747]|nr:hypothetical protein N6H14_14705 [Paenibacillus sp. CC-CFT747]
MKINFEGEKWGLGLYLPELKNADFSRLYHRLERISLGIRGEEERINGVKLWPNQGGYTIRVKPQLIPYNLVDHQEGWLSRLEAEWITTVPGLEEHGNVFVNTSVGFCRLRPGGSIRTNETFYFVAASPTSFPRDIVTSELGSLGKWRAWELKFKGSILPSTESWFEKMGYRLTESEYRICLLKPAVFFLDAEGRYHVQKHERVLLYIELRRAVKSFSFHHVSLQVTQIKPPLSFSAQGELKELMLDLEELNVGTHVIYSPELEGLPLSLEVHEKGSLIPEGKHPQIEVTLLDGNGQAVGQRVMPQEVIAIEPNAKRIKVAGPKGLKSQIYGKDDMLLFTDSLPFELDLRSSGPFIDHIAFSGYGAVKLLVQDKVESKETEIKLLENICLKLQVSRELACYRLSPQVLARLHQRLIRLQVDGAIAQRIYLTLYRFQRRIPLAAVPLINYLLEHD